MVSASLQHVQTQLLLAASQANTLNITVAPNSVCAQRTPSVQCPALSCKPGLVPSGPAGSCNQECIPAPATNSPTITVTESPSTVAQGFAFQAGGSVQISWSTQNAPADSAVFIYLIPSDGSSKYLLLGKQPTTGSYTWTEQSPLCVGEDECEVSLGGPGTYKIMAELYSPSDACYGQICPGRRQIHTDILATGQSTDFTVTPSASAANAGSTMTTSANGSSVPTGSSGTGFVINLNWANTTVPAAFKTAVINAANYLTSQFTDPITVTLTVYYQPLGAGVLGMAGPNTGAYLPYSQLLSAISADVVTADDAMGVSTLPATDPGVGFGQWWLGGAEQKALKLPAASGTDGEVYLSSDFSWCTDPTTGCPSGYDAQGVALHEITHALSRVVGDGTGVYLTGQDLFRFSAPGVRNIRDNTGGYFSIDNGTTNLGGYSGSSDYADWDGGHGADALNAYVGGGVQPFTESDLKLMDSIGFNRATSSSIPRVTSITESPSSGTAVVGTVITFTLGMSTSITVTGTPTLTLNDGGTASYTGGSGTQTLTFSYTVGAADSAALSLAATAINLTNGTMKDAGGTSVSTNIAGISQKGPQIGADTTPPSVPTNLTGNAVSATAVSLIWSASTDNWSVTGYKVFRNGSQIATPSGASYVDSSAAAGTTYSYTVAAFDASGNTSAQPSPISVTTPTPTTNFAVGARVKSTSNLNVRNKANSNAGKIQCTQPAGALGTITGGPTGAQGYTWWNVDFDTSCDGWVVQSYLTTSLAVNPSPLGNVAAAATAADTLNMLTAMAQQLKETLAAVEAMIAQIKTGVSQ
jgi:chitodextrinase